MMNGVSLLIRKITVIIGFLMIGLYNAGWSQNPILELVGCEGNQWTYRYRCNPISAEGINVDNSRFSRIFMHDHMLSSEVGVPQLPVFVSLIDIPFCQDVEIDIVKVDYNYFTGDELGVDAPIWPSQPSYSKSEIPSPLVMDKELYAQDDFFGFEPVSIERRGVMRSANIAALSVSPIKYNPVLNEFMVCSEMVFSLTFIQTDNAKTASLKRIHQNDCFARQFEQVLTASPLQTKGVIYNSPIRYLIVSDPMFKDELQDFIAWKKRLGFVVDAVYTDEPEVGNTTVSIQKYLKSQYEMASSDNPAPTYVLLVGDVEQIPAFKGTKGNYVTDLYYFDWTGDYLPDCYYGRLSAQNVPQLHVQLEKTLTYEQCRFADMSYLNHAVLVAGSDKNYSPTYANGQVNYLYDNYINENNGYSQVKKYLYDSGSLAAEIRDEIGKGTGFANYTAHCGAYGWRTPRFDTTHVAGLTNEGRYGLMLANCCESGKFEISSCFAEAMMRAQNKGVVAYIGASGETYWNEDYYWTVGYRRNVVAEPSYDARYLGAYDRLFHAHNEPVADWSTTNGALLAAGNLSVEQTSSTRKLCYWEIYHLFGDPSLSPWLGIPQVMTLNLSDSLKIGSSMLHVSAAPYANVSLTHDSVWIATAKADADGKALLRFPLLTDPGSYEVVASAQNYQTAFKTVTVSDYDSLQLMVVSLTWADSLLPSVGNHVCWNMKIENVGTQNIDSLTLRILSVDKSIIITDSVVYIDHFNVKDSVVANAFSALLPLGLEDEMIAQFDVSAIYHHRIDTTHFFFNLFAPKWRNEEHFWKVINGDDNQYVDAGETARLYIETRNVGHVFADSIVSRLSTDSSCVEIFSSSDSISYLDVDEEFISQFEIRVDDDVKPFTVIPLCHHVEADNVVMEDTIYLMVGCAMEDFETGDFTSYRWIQGSYPWIITHEQSFNGNYSARSAQSLQDDQTSSFSITLNVLHNDSLTYYRKVSSESEFDFFTLAVDDVVRDKASGNETWTRVSVPVSAGVHQFVFSYAKDVARAEGEDAAWLDNIVLPANSSLLMTDDYSADNELYIYPNPASDKITVSSSNPFASLQILDMNGKCVKKFINIATRLYEIDIHDLSEGLYLIKMGGAHGESSLLKLIKHH